MGIKVNSSWTYNASFYYRFPTFSSYSGSVVLALTDSSSSTVYGSASVTLDGSQTSWAQVAVAITPTESASSTSNKFTISILDAAGKTINFAMFSLFQPTFKNRRNGMRIDIAETLATAKPAFFRFPGGNNLEVVLVIGDMQTQMVLDFSSICTVLKMQGRNRSWLLLFGRNRRSRSRSCTVHTKSHRSDQFCRGDASESSAATLRASLGHPEPFSLKYVEIGNEDFLPEDSYVYRWQDFAGNLSAVFPDIRFIATSYPTGPTLTLRPNL